MTQREYLFTKTVRGRREIDEKALLTAVAEKFGGAVIPNPDQENDRRRWNGRHIISVDGFEIGVEGSVYHFDSDSPARVELMIRYRGIEYNIPHYFVGNDYARYSKMPEWPLYNLGGYGCGRTGTFSLNRPFQQLINLVQRRLLDPAKALLQEYRAHLDALSEEAAKLSVVAERLRERGFDVQLNKQLDGGKFSRRREGEPHFKGRFYEKGKVKFSDLELTTEQFERFVDALEIKPTPKPVKSEPAAEEAEPKPEAQPPKRPIPRRVSMWEALDEQKNRNA